MSNEIKSPGWARFRRRLGAKAAEALRKDTLRLQAEAMENIRREKAAGTNHIRDGAPKKHMDYPNSRRAK